MCQQYCWHINIYYKYYWFCDKLLTITSITDFVTNCSLLRHLHVTYVLWFIPLVMMTNPLATLSEMYLVLVYHKEVQNMYSICALFGLFFVHLSNQICISLFSKHVEWMKAFTGAIKELEGYVTEYHKTGLTWNPSVSSSVDIHVHFIDYCTCV